MASKAVAATSAARAVAARANSSGSLASKPGLELLYTTHLSWPYPPATSRLSASLQTTVSPSSPASDSLDIAVLDSSFNPPSNAHLALTLSRPLLAHPRSGKRPYDAHLVLFSTENADKGKGKKDDASLEQRLHMMTLLAKQIEHELEQQQAQPNVAVALVDKPLIFAKSTLTWDALRRKGVGSDERLPRPRLHWVVGFDTLYRVFQPKYYPSEEEMERQCSAFFEDERTTFVCGRRDAGSFPSLSSSPGQQEAADEERKLLESPRVKKWVDRGSVAMLDLKPEQARLSSTQIREILRDGETPVEEKRKQLEPMVPPLLLDYLLESGVYAREE